MEEGIDMQRSLSLIIGKIVVMICGVLFFANICNANTITVPTTWITGDSVTATKLNNINSTFANVINGGLDNNNADTANGYFFFKRVAALPSAGTQGAVYFLTSDNTLNLDTGAAFVTAATISGTHAQGDIIYYNGSSFTGLAAGTSGYVLKTQGAGANPTWTDPTSGHVLYADSRFKMGSFTRALNAGTGDVAYTGVGFTPKFIMFFGGVVNDDVATYNGYSDGTSNSCLADYGYSSAGFNNWQNDSSIALYNSGATNEKAIVKSFDADGFTLTWTLSGAGVASTANITYVAFR